ncbi:carbohydrate ABC transporter permease [Cohnella sp. GCM10020058]|uniref:carbohydrate ABC transporter permease n=1 Tax=Cohnella sp. GCM10020058 TaxID=3317330 RepID=UPI00362EB373
MSERTLKLRDAAVPYIYILPFLVSFAAFFVYPSFYSLKLSFYRYKGYGTAQWVGWDNYSNALHYSTFWQSIGNTLFYLVGHIFPVMILSFILAVFLHGKAVRRKSVYKPLIFLPQVVTAVAGALVFQIFFSTQSGVINNWLGTEIPFLQNPALIKWPVIAFLVWRGIGWYLVIYLAGLTTINEEVNEAALIDGASAMQRLLRITIPLMKPIFLFAFMIDAIASLKIYTEPNLMLNTAGNMPTAAMPVVNLLVNNINSGSFGMASAIGWLLFLLTLIVSAVQYAALRGRD